MLLASKDPDAKEAKNEQDEVRSTCAVCPVSLWIG